QVDVHDMPEFLGRQPGGRNVVGDPGVVDEHIEAAEPLYGGVDQRLAVLVAGDVRRYRERVAARGPDQLDGRAEPVGPSGRDDDIGAGPGTRLGVRHAEAGRGTRDQHDPVVQTEAVDRRAVGDDPGGGPAIR